MTSTNPSRVESTTDTEDGDAPEMTKRGVLKKIGVTAAGLTGLSSVSTSAAAFSPPQPQRVCGSDDFSSGDGSRWNTVDIKVIDMTDEFDHKADSIMDGFCDAFEKLENQTTWFGGYRIQLIDIGYVYEGEPGDRSDLEKALDNVGETDSKHYHVVYDGADGGSHHQKDDSDSIWGSDEREISGLGMMWTAPKDATAYVRGPHQALHNYIADSVAHNLTDDAYDDAYDATHALGVETDNYEYHGYFTNGHVRSIMADIRAEKTRFGCTDRTQGPVDSSIAPRDNIYFSDCTKKALYYSALNNRPAW